mgnify:CR=1 FL=1
MEIVLIHGMIIVDRLIVRMRLHILILISNVPNLLRVA